METDKENIERFKFLRGYSSFPGIYHLKGEIKVDQKGLLQALSFEGVEDFKNWWDSISENDFKNYTKEWCYCNKCQNLTDILVQEFGLKPKPGYWETKERFVTLKMP